MPANTRLSFVDLGIPKSARRIVVDVHAGLAQTLTIEVEQGGITFPMDITNGRSVAFEVD